MKLVKVVDEKKFLKIINVADIDRYVKKLTAHKFLQLFIIAQLNELDRLKRLSTIKNRFMQR
ncbi:DUF4372 domain-containing protein [Halobacillus shinanisalinarum]|uniref:DUF4372 domain-containing protein n=1 Tax=Halobacillus shinanisalinarum TaxID=2932258 RepID=UPI0037BE50F0